MLRINAVGRIEHVGPDYEERSQPALQELDKVLRPDCYLKIYCSIALILSQGGAGCLQRQRLGPCSHIFEERRVHLRAIVAVARFLKGAPVRAVWCQFFNDKWKECTRRRLILAPEVDLDAQAIVQFYARRWDIEPLRHNLKLDSAPLVPQSHRHPL
jgi:hypothetical protein